MSIQYIILNTFAAVWMTLPALLYAASCLVLFYTRGHVRPKYARTFTRKFLSYFVSHISDYQWKTKFEHGAPFMTFGNFIFGAFMLVMLTVIEAYNWYYQFGGFIVACIILIIPRYVIDRIYSEPKNK